MATKSHTRVKIPKQFWQSIKQHSLPKKVFTRRGVVDQLKSEVELLTSYATDTIYRLNFDTMQYDYVSPASKNLLGYTPEEMKNINFRSLILETKILTDGMKKIRSYDELEKKRIAGDVNKWQADYLIKTKDGRQIWVSDISYPWFDEAGNIKGTIGSLRDITERIEVENQIKEEFVRLAHTDPLTRIANRRAFFEKLEDELKRLKRTHSDVSILLIDLDHFKKINDKYGHDLGDKVLIEIAGIIKSSIRETDLGARLGGEEFGVFLPDTPGDSAYWVAERICKNIAKHTFTFEDTPPVGCTVSIGIASTSFMEAQNATELYKMADTRLYIAKNTGRNQVSMDEIVLVH